MDVFERYNMKEPELVNQERLLWPSEVAWENQIKDIEETFEWIKTQFVAEYNAQSYLEDRLIKPSLSILLAEQGMHFYGKYPLARKFITEKLKEDLGPLLQKLQKKPPTEAEIDLIRASQRRGTHDKT